MLAALLSDGMIAAGSFIQHLAFPSVLGQLPDKIQTNAHRQLVVKCETTRENFYGRRSAANYFPPFYYTFSMFICGLKVARGRRLARPATNLED